MCLTHSPVKNIVIADYFEWVTGYVIMSLVFHPPPSASDDVPSVQDHGEDVMLLCGQVLHKFPPGGEWDVGSSCTGTHKSMDVSVGSLSVLLHTALGVSSSHTKQK